MQAAQIYSRQFFSLLSAAGFTNVRPGICDFVEALTIHS